MESCERCKYQDKREDEVPCVGCMHNAVNNFETMTQTDRIRSMTDEDLAWFLCKVKADYQWVDQEFPREDEVGEWEEWLKSEVGCE